jgi:ribosomal protein S18 acetylase RimI-like enzyme
VEIRRATVEDAFSMAVVHVRSWQVAYRGHMPDDYLDAIDVEKRANMWRQLTQDPSKIILVAEDDESCMVGLSALGASRDSDANPSTAEVSAIYVHPDKWDRGIGRGLMTASLDELRRREPFDEVTLWVLEANHRARAFYEKFGFVRDGTVKDDDHWQSFTLREVRYRLNLRLVNT